MKSALAFSVLLGCCGVLLGDSPERGLSSPGRPAALLDDLVRMTRAGSSDAAVLAYARAHRVELPPELSDADLRWLRDSGVAGRVVSYMSAIDVRASSEAVEEEVSDDAGFSDDASHPRAAYSSGRESDRRGYGEDVAGGDLEGDRDLDLDAYSDSGSGYGYGYDDAFYPSLGYGFSAYADPYPSFFFIDRGRAFRGSHRRDHHFRGHRGFDGGAGFRHRRGGADRGGSRDSWRDRGSREGRGRTVVVAPRGSRRSRGPAFASGGSRAGGRPIGDRGFGRPGSGHAAFPGRSGVHGRGGFGHPGFSTGSRAGRGFSRGPVGVTGGGRAVAGHVGGRGRR